MDTRKKPSLIEALVLQSTTNIYSEIIAIRTFTNTIDDKLAEVIRERNEIAKELQKNMSAKSRNYNDYSALSEKAIVAIQKSKAIIEEAQQSSFKGKEELLDILNSEFSELERISPQSVEDDIRSRVKSHKESATDLIKVAWEKREKMLANVNNRLEKEVIALLQGMVDKLKKLGLSTAAQGMFAPAAPKSPSTPPTYQSASAALEPARFSM